MKTAIITGATGQDGSYLCRLLLDKGYQVYATYRRSSSADLWRWRELGLVEGERLHVVEYNSDDVCSATRLIERAQPDEVYNLAAQTFVASSFDQPVSTTRTNTFGSLHLLEAIRTIDRRIRLYQASSAEMFGKVQAVPQDETTPFYPRSPYGISKLCSHWLAVNYRESYGIFACSGILFNHESPLRGREFVTRKISEAAARIGSGDPRPCRLGNVNARRDWGFAGDYVEGMWRMLQADNPDTYVLATNRTETVRDFATMAFAAVNLQLHWEGQGEDERAYVAGRASPVIEIDPQFYRPAEVDLLVGDSTKAQDRLGWRAETRLEALCTMMVEADVRRLGTASASGPAQVH
ncbi:GDP-mannose 4,6-dehydratase [Lichenihabitans sp. Uapishka_5]|uniref:GDP-mannose 4,6-dehydratase n=1 Tax=Lichenihabitans sp. Uapishka_5 TaxID=3037302 RepID=UPI0029E8233B|nr:GDP-mannose 4,6-dehydratase [Lichenihabitans sp. Uapishka_5]MDX7950252.1 GDP-mannose 4,6-dehydratase [Lichenihabitans sp. Uapishka_5]